jgi:glycosyltransferase involved in cell wall biosynthesis
LNILVTALHPVGGIRTYFRYVYGNKEFSHINITIVAPDEGLTEFLQDNIPDCKVRVVATNGAFDFIKKLRKLLKTENFDVLHAHGFSAGAMSYLGSRFIRIKTMMTGHDVFNQAQFSGFKGKIKKLGLSYVFKNLDAINTISDDAQNNLLETFPQIKKERVHPILNGIDTEFFANGVSNNLRENIKLNDGQKLLGFYGRFMAQKGFNILVEAIAKLVQLNPNTAPKVLTFGWGGFIREEFESIKQKGLADYFIQMEATDDMPANLRAVDLVAIPSRWEACPLLPMEALCSAVPIVGTECLGLREILKGSPAQVVKVNSVESLIEGINQGLKEEEKLRAKEYQAIALKRFSVDVTALKLKSLYFEISQESKFI